MKHLNKSNHPRIVLWIAAALFRCRFCSGADTGERVILGYRQNHFAWGLIRTVDISGQMELLPGQ